LFPLLKLSGLVYMLLRCLLSTHPKYYLCRRPDTDKCPAECISTH